jgi:hypothetical protein
MLRSALVSVCVVVAAAVAYADEPDTSAQDLAAQCAGKNGLFDPNTNECAEPNPDSAAGDLVVGPMMKGLAPDAQGTDQ